MRLRLTLAIALFHGVALARALTVPAVLGDHMVLQAGVPAPVWGWGDPGEKVSVSFAGQTKPAVAGSDGRWEVRLDPLSVSAQPAQLTITGSRQIILDDVLVGEVWLCSGQSNMEKPLSDQRGQHPTFNFEAELKAANYPQIRMLKVARARTANPARDFKGSWTPCSPTSLDEIKFSAVGYFFARRVFEEMHVPIGVIDSSFGGSPIEPWIPAGAFASEPSLAVFAQAAQHPGAKVNSYQGVVATPLDICTMYNGMIAPMVPFALRGVLWYQGESNIYAGDEAIYTDKMAALINGWRTVWHSELPFYYVQVAPLLYHVTRSHLVVSPEAEPRFWEAQAACLRLPRTGMVITTDLVDDLTDIHPRNKKDVGERLARWALNRDYGHTEIEPWGPVYQGMSVRDAEAIVTFEHATGGLVARDKKPLNWFIIAGADGVFHPARAEIEGDHVRVSSPLVAHPTAVRFGWDEAAQPNLYNGAGLPARPFRSDGPAAVTTR